MIVEMVIVVVLAVLVGALAFVLRHVIWTLADMQAELDHAHEVAHAAVAMLAMHLSGDDVDIPVIRLRTDDKE